VSNADTSSRTLILFDIDGTLLYRASLAQAQAMYSAVAELYGVDPGAVFEIPKAGRTDLEIARDFLSQSGVETSEIDAKIEDLMQLWFAEHERIVPESLADTVIDGVDRLLGELSQRDELFLSLVTGNLESTAHSKLRRAGLSRYFSKGHGGFGSDSELREDLPAVARKRAAKAVGLSEEWPRERSVVVGDTPRDIACAKADDLRCIAVTSGPYSFDDLGAADAVAKDSEQLLKLITEFSASNS